MFDRPDIKRGRGGAQASAWDPLEVSNRSDRQGTTPTADKHANSAKATAGTNSGRAAERLTDRSRNPTVVARRPEYRSVAQRLIKPVLPIPKKKTSTVAVPTPRPNPTKASSTTLPEGIVSPSEPTGPNPAKDQEKLAGAFEKQVERCAKPEIDLALIAKIVRDGVRFLTEREVAAYLNISMSVMRNWRVAGGVGPKTTRIGTRAVRFDPADVREFVERGRK